MNYRNARYIDATRIDCEIEHHVHGWIPYTLDLADTDMTVNNDDLLAAMAENGDVDAYVPPTQAETAEELAVQLEALKDAIITRFDQPTSIDKVLFKISFLQENRIRALEGKQPITAQQFKDWVRSQID